MQNIPERLNQPASNRDMSTENFYQNFYQTVETGDAKGSFHRATHRALERGLTSTNFNTVLEVGANRGEHLKFVQHGFNKYVLLDFRKQSEYLEALDDPRCEYRQANVEELPFNDSEFDRIVCTCVMHHTASPTTALKEMRRVLGVGGTISILLPCDPGWSYRTAWKLSSGRALRKQGVSDPYLLHVQEHPQHFPGLAARIRSVFEGDDIRVKWAPFPLPWWNLNLYTVWTIIKR